MGTIQITVETTVRILTEDMFGEMQEYFLTLPYLPMKQDAEIQDAVFEAYGELEYEIVNTNLYQNAL